MKIGLSPFTDKISAISPSPKIVQYYLVFPRYTVYTVYTDVQFILETSEADTRIRTRKR